MRSYFCVSFFDIMNLTGMRVVVYWIGMSAVINLAVPVSPQ